MGIVMGSTTLLLVCCHVPFTGVKHHICIATAGDSKGVYNGVIDCFVKTLQHDGLKAFYSGFIPNFARLGSWNVCMFLTLEQVCCRTLCKLCRNASVKCADPRKSIRREPRGAMQVKKAMSPLALEKK